ncbi:MAG: class I SAM-dependent methyltransferase [Candidatus Wallbacteria bacterium]|nr:class I SAM-dependent methyltransferase [Candidatus Wallbacteria bacterium]
MSSPALVDVDCAVCGQGPGVTALLKAVRGPEEPGRIARCGGCGHMFVSPRHDDVWIAQSYADSGLAAEYLVRLYLPHEVGRRRVMEGFLDEIERHTPGRGRLLDVGAATGLLASLATDRGWQATGVEPSEPARRFGFERYGVRLLPGFFEQLPWTPGAYDCVTMLDVLEHVVRPVECLRAAVESLAPGGLVAILTPNWDSLSRRLLGGRWDAVVPSGHLHYFRPCLLARLLETLGLELLEATTRGLPGLGGRPRWRRPLERLGLGEAIWVLGRKMARAS